MEKTIIPGRHGYDIPWVGSMTGRETLTVIISHGLGSSKQSPTAQAVSAALQARGIGTCAFDFPGHGDSPAEAGMFRVENCVDDLAAVEAYVRRQNPACDVGYFSSSFGAYINLIYLSTRTHAGCKSFLRCTAVDMAGLFCRGTTPEQQAALDTQGYYMLDLDYVRPLKIMREFLSELDRYDLFQLYRPGPTRLAMIHGTDDETAPVEDARRFAVLSGAAFTEVVGADHRFTLPGGLERILDTALDFFNEAPIPKDVSVRLLTERELSQALQLVRRVFMEFEAPDYSAEGVEHFQRFLEDGESIRSLTGYGAFQDGELVGVLAIRSGGSHISLFFVDSRWHRQGIGTALFRTMMQNGTTGTITVHSSPFAVEIYRRLGFTDTAPEQLEHGIRYIPMVYKK